MKLKDIQTVNDLENYIEGMLNDFEAKVSDKEETKELIADLIIHIQKHSKNRKLLRKYIKDGYHCPECNSTDIVYSYDVFICLDCRHEWESDDWITTNLKQLL